MRQPPYVSSYPTEAVDVALVAAAFESSVAILFEGPGVWQLLKDQQGPAVNSPTQGDVLATLPDYGITDIYVCAESLEQFGLSVDDLVLPAIALSRAEQRTLIASHPLVVND